MQLPKILTNPHPILRKKAEEIHIKSIQSKVVQDLIFTMKQVLKKSDDGVGLAAPQIGNSVRIFLVSEEADAIDKEIPIEEDKKKNWNYQVFINPVIKKLSSKKVEMAEGCLSVPGTYGLVRRPEKITVEWHDEHGKKHARGCSKFFARVIQHETDHLNGILFIDKMYKEVAMGKEKNRL